MFSHNVSIRRRVLLLFRLQDAKPGFRLTTKNYNTGIDPQRIHAMVSRVFDAQLCRRRVFSNGPLTSP